jgi:uncharacterized protein YlxW (UPF0749 family)
MDLLLQIIRQPMDPDYAEVAQRPQPPRSRVALVAVAVVVGAMFAVAALQTNRGAPALAVERAELIQRIQVAEAEQDQLRTRSAALTADISVLRSAALGTDERARSLQTQINTLDPVVGEVAVVGPGLLITVDDSPRADQRGSQEGERDRVLDLDLQTLVNGLWTAGAEAVAVNGHRITTQTAIRGAGDAITVNYRSLTRPYRVQAIGDPRSLEARYVESSAGAWWNELAQNRGMAYEISSEERLTLPADSGAALRYAKAGPS